MKNNLYLDLTYGISGDMFVASLLDLGVDKKALVKKLKTLPLKGYEIKIKKVLNHSIEVMDFDVVLEEDNHDHDMQYLYDLNYKDKDHHSHDHHHHIHRGLKEINEIIDHSKLTKEEKTRAKSIFEIIAKAEAKAHGKKLDEVHFHEVGAIDSIVDVCAAAICICSLKIKNTYINTFNEGTGMVRSQHGLLPIPVPAVSNILSQHKLKLKINKDWKGERITPTGAAIVASLKPKELLNDFSINKIGLGNGKRQYDNPSYLRSMLIDVEDNDASIYKLECNVDDITGEQMGYAMERLFDKGAYDVHIIPCYMKKNRPGFLLQVICSKDKVNALEEVIFLETTTTGIRKQIMETNKLDRKIVKVKTKYGVIDCKSYRINDEVRYHPEYEDVKKLCKKHHLSFNQMYQLILKEISK